jgi:uncharacterized protein YceH (UPF0502 family)
VLSFAGADEAAANKLERAHTRTSRTPRLQPRESEITENEFGKFVGVRQSIGSKDRFNIEVFQALDIAVHKAMLSEEPAQTDEALRAFQARSARASHIAQQQSRQTVLTTREKGAVVVKSAGPDGSLLQIRVSPP